MTEASEMSKGEDELVADLYRILNSDDAEARHAILHSELSEDVWFALLAMDPDMVWIVRFAGRLPFSVLRALAESTDRTIRSSIAMKRRLPPDLFEKFSVDECEGVRSTIAHNKKTPLEILERLAYDPVEDVADSARGRLAERRKVKGPE